jgi:serine/threonine protein kinase/tetratricopeptide (TPR) repeat protein
MNRSQAAESKATQSVCAQCGSQFSSLDDVENFCATCLLHIALSDQPGGRAPRLHRFDQYELITGNDGAPVELGRGAMGVTYKAFDTNLRYEVALKVIHPRYLAHESSRARFLSEARAAAQLRHRNIASVFHLGSERDEYFYAMELVDGETIEEWVRRKGPLDCLSALEVTLQIARALIATGGRRFVHRDIKPSNIMLCTEADGAIVAKLIDFGLVRAISDQSASVSASPSRSGFVGTPHYASPEQFVGATTDERSDIYSLGVTLWYMLLAKLPASGTREEIQQQKLSGALPLKQLKGIPRAVVDLIKRMLDLDPAKRPRSPAVLKEQLHKCMAVIDSARQRQQRRFVYTTLAAAALIVAALGAFYIFRASKVIPGPTSNIVPEKSIAVLPFENLSNDREDASFADGVQDDLLTKLATISDLKVISRTSVMHYGGKHNMREIGEALGVSYVLQGSVRKTGSWLHINAQLIDTHTDTHSWAEEYDRNLKELFAVQSQIAQQVAQRLHAKISAAEKLAIERPPTVDLTAFDLYSRAKNLFLRVGFSSNERANLLEMADLLNQAVTHDASFLQAYCLLSSAHGLLYFLGLDHTTARLKLAEAAIQAASRIHPNAAETHLARAQNLYQGYLDYDGALAEVRVARQNLPNDPRVFELTGYIQRRQGHWEESTRSLERAIEFDPRNLNLLEQITLNYRLLRRYAEEKSAWDRMVAIEPNNVETQAARGVAEFRVRAETRVLHQVVDSVRATNPDALPTIAENWLICSLAERDAAAARNALSAAGDNPINLGGDVYFNHPFVEGVIARMMKDDQKARSAFIAARAEQERIIQAQPNFAPAVCVMGLIDAALGEKEDALREGRRAVESLPVQKDAYRGNSMILYLAMIAAWAGDKDLACDQLAIAVRPPSIVSYGSLKLLPWWDPLHGDPRFEQIVASLAPK